jgi:superfamily II DNA or RNA helicase
MPRVARNRGKLKPSSSTTKYDAHHVVLDKTYGAFADLRRELSDSKAEVSERTAILNSFANCEDSQRAWLLLEDYFDRLSLSRKDFAGQDWWQRMLEARGNQRLETMALLFLRANRPLPSELIAHANFERLAQIEQEEQEQKYVTNLEAWLLPPKPLHLDAPRARLHVLCSTIPLEDHKGLLGLKVEFGIFKPRTGLRMRKLSELVELATRSPNEKEQFSQDDWRLIQWLAGNFGKRTYDGDMILLGADLLLFLARWGQTQRLEDKSEDNKSFKFYGHMAELIPHLEALDNDLSLVHRLKFPSGDEINLPEACFLAGLPVLTLHQHTFFLVPSAPSPEFFGQWVKKPALAVRKLSHRLLTHLRQTAHAEGGKWEELCITHTAKPQFLFELENDTVRLRLLAKSDLNSSIWQWNGHEWKMTSQTKTSLDKPEILDDDRLQAATQWLRQLDWFTPEPGLWIGDANENFLNVLAAAWPDRPLEADFLGNSPFQRLFLEPQKLKPKVVLNGSGIDWLSVSTEWEQEGMKLSVADLERLQTATGRFVKLPDRGWIELDSSAVQKARETLADLGVDTLNTTPDKVSLLHAKELDEDTINRLGSRAQVRSLKKRLEKYSGIPSVKIPDRVEATMRPYQKEGLDFLCHLSKLKLGGILADDMGLGKTLQTLAWLAWLDSSNGSKSKPSLVICPASVLHNWRREANRFTPYLKVLVLESGAARHNLRKQIPEHNIIITNYSLLRRDLDALQKFSFDAVILDEAQFIKNPDAQITQSVKKIRSRRRLALTGTPLENRLLDLWSIVDFVMPNYLGDQSSFQDNYDARGANSESTQRISRRRLSAKLRPILLRRLKRQVAKDLPERIEERRDCELVDSQRKLYLAELRRSREKVMKTISEKGIARSKIHVLAALTRLRQICCHPQLVGNDSGSGKTDTLFELLEPLMDEGQKVLVFSQFVQMLKLLEGECRARGFSTHILTGETKNRQEIVSSFQKESEASVFLLSLRAAGTGLNLTNASYVVVYDPWWNPAVEAQAIDRSHRIGQTQTVNAYKLIAPGTVEEKIWELQQRKAATISDVLGEEGFARSLDKEDLEYLFAED